MRERSPKPVNQLMEINEKTALRRMGSSPLRAPVRSPVRRAARMLKGVVREQARVPMANGARLADNRRRPLPVRPALHQAKQAVAAGQAVMARVSPASPRPTAPRLRRRPNGASRIWQTPAMLRTSPSST